MKLVFIRESYTFIIISAVLAEHMSYPFLYFFGKMIIEATYTARECAGE